MKLYYTGAPIANMVQENPNQSLGGCKSSTGVPNGRKNSLFSDIATEQLNNGDRDIRGLILKNETGNTVNSITAYFQPDYTGVTNLDLSNIVSEPIFSISGTLGEIVKLTIPSSTVDPSHLDLYNRVSEGKVGGGDFWTVNLIDIAPTQAIGVILDVKSASIVGSDAEIIFEAPNYTSLGLLFATTTIDIVPVANYTFTSLDKVTDGGDYEIAAVTVNNDKIESVNDSKSLPYVGTFTKANGIANRVLLVNSMLDLGQIGLWIIRNVSIKPKTACEDLEAEKENQLKIETMNLVIDYV